MAVIPLTELAALEEACIVFWKQKNSAKAFGTASCMNSRRWRGIWGTQKSLYFRTHLQHTHTPYTRLLGNRMFTATSTGCYQALCHLITIQYCNKAIFQPTMVVKLKATSIWSCLTLAMWSCLTLAISPRSFEWIFDNRLSVSNACNYIQSKYHLYEAPGVCATVKNALCIPFGTPRPRHVTNERHLGKQPDAILFYAFTNISRQTFPIARTTISHLQTNVHHTLNNFVIDLSGPEVLPTQIADVGSAVVPYATEQLPQQRKQPSFTGYLQTGPY